jgi:hypothetical protein
LSPRGRHDGRARAADLMRPQRLGALFIARFLALTSPLSAAAIRNSTCHESCKPTRRLGDWQPEEEDNFFIQVLENL